jgi:hypothetical protein
MIAVCYAKNNYLLLIWPIFTTLRRDYDVISSIFTAIDQKPGQFIQAIRDNLNIINKSIIYLKIT